MNPALEKITFRAYGLTWSLDGSHEIKPVGASNVAARNLLQSYVDQHAGTHIPTIDVIESFEELPGVKIEILKREPSDEPAYDVE